MADNIISFVRQKDYKLIKEIGSGACGKTVLLHDEIIDEHFVCKKYAPYDEVAHIPLYKRFVDEIKILHKAFHKNIVRVYNYYLYPELHAGYILMENIEGQDFDVFIQDNPEKINSIFLQVVEGFRYLEEAGILHRDIRPSNIMITHDGLVKIIDFGFGKSIKQEANFDKSISLNWWCNLPDDFTSSTYNFQTEVYFIGKLFELAIKTLKIDNFKYPDLLSSMCKMSPEDRIRSFSEVDSTMKGKVEDSALFSDSEVLDYREFSSSLSYHLTKIEEDSEINQNVENIRLKLENVYRDSMLEETLPDASELLRIFIKGSYHLHREGFKVVTLRKFIDLLNSSSPSKRKLIYANLQTRLRAIPRYVDIDLGDAPF